jgi:thymidylate synthase
MQMYQRSVDVFLGLPFNIASYALLTHILAHITGLRVGTLSMALGDTHIYESHLPEMLIQIRRKPGPLPTLQIGRSREVERSTYDPRRALHSETVRVDFEEDTGPQFPDQSQGYGRQLNEIEDFTSVGNFNLRGYHSHGPLRGKMAV